MPSHDSSTIPAALNLGDAARRPQRLAQVSRSMKLWYARVC